MCIKKCHCQKKATMINPQTIDLLRQNIGQSVENENQNRIIATYFLTKLDEIAAYTAEGFLLDQIESCVDGKNQLIIGVKPEINLSKAMMSYIADVGGFNEEKAKNIVTSMETTLLIRDPILLMLANDRFNKKVDKLIRKAYKQAGIKFHVVEYPNATLNEHKESTKVIEPMMTVLRDFIE